MTILYVANLSGKISEAKNMEKGFPLWIGVVAFALLLYLFTRYKQASVIQREKYINEPPENDFHDWTNDQS